MSQDIVPKRVFGSYPVGIYSNPASLNLVSGTLNSKFCITGSGAEPTKQVILPEPVQARIPLNPLPAIRITYLSFSGTDVGQLFRGSPDDDYRIIINDQAVLDARRNVGDYPFPFFFEYTEELSLGSAVSIDLFNGWINAFTTPLTVYYELSNGDTRQFTVIEETQNFIGEPAPAPIPSGFFDVPQFVRYHPITTFQLF